MGFRADTASVLCPKPHKQLLGEAASEGERGLG
jgi:hypothetical protein